ncbi:MAG: Calx-beta domain-containing protein, partial [Pseudomonadota bacterium]
HFKIYPYTNLGANVDYKTDGAPVMASTLTNSGGFIINEINADPDAVNGDANNDSVVDTVDDEFVEIINNTGGAVDISGWTLSDAVGIKHTFTAMTNVANGCGIVIFGAGTPTGSFGNMLVQTASTGQLGLNNAGDTITLNDGVNDIVVQSYGTAGGNNQSLTRAPDLTGGLVQHSGVGAGGALFSPGIKIDGSNFAACVGANPEPANQATALTASADSSSQITTRWTDAVAGAQVPTAYLVMCNTTGTFSMPADGTIQLNDTNCADGAGIQNVTHSTEMAIWAGLNASTQYFFKVFSYTNSGVLIDFKIDGVPPTANTTTLAPVTLPPPMPVISLRANGNNLPDGIGQIDFGTTPIDAAIEQTIVIGNFGTAVLFLAPPSLPLGFSLSSVFPNVINIGGQIEFTIQFKPQVSGVHTGEFLFGNNSSNNPTFNFTLIGHATDNDGVNETIENNGPNDGDANADGILDSEQNNVVSLPNAVTGEYLTLHSPNCELSNVYVDTEDNQSSQDLGYTYPQGLLGFELTNCNQTELTLYLHGLKSSLDLHLRVLALISVSNSAMATWHALSNASFSTELINGNTAATARWVIADNQTGDNANAADTIAVLFGAAYNPGLVGFNSDAFHVDEKAEYVRLEVSRVGDFGELSLSYVTTDDTAVDGQDYQAAQGSLFWADGEEGTKAFEIKIIDNALFDGNKTALAELGQLLSAGADLALKHATLTILDDESAQPGRLGFTGLAGLTAASEAGGILLFNVPENAGTLNVRVDRTQGGLGTVSVDYLTESGHRFDSAVAGEDYQINPGTLRWEEGELIERLFEIKIIDDQQQEQDELFFVNLENPTGSAVLGKNTSIAIRILDDDAPRCNSEYRSGLSTGGETDSCFSSRLDTRHTAPISFIRKNQHRRISIQVKPDTRHLNAPAELLLIASWQPFVFGPSLEFAYNGDRWVLWNGEIEDLPAAEAVSNLPEQLELIAWDDLVSDLLGNLRVFTGYRLVDGEIVHNGNWPFDLIILP